MRSTINRRFIGLAGLGLLAAASLGYAQVQQGKIAPPEFGSRRAPQPSDVVLSGADIGFRLEGRKGDAVVGRLVVRVNGEWREVAANYGAKPLTGR